MQSGLAATGTVCEVGLDFGGFSLSLLPQTRKPYHSQLKPKHLRIELTATPLNPVTLQKIAAFPRQLTARLKCLGKKEAAKVKATVSRLLADPRRLGLV